MKENIKGKLSFVLALSTWILIIVGIILTYSFNVGKHETSERLLHAFYTFNLDTISENDALIQKLTTDEIYQSHTISSSNRQLRVYLKFEGKPTEAVILRHEGNQILYHIISEGFDPERTFALEYKYKWGKIVDVVEYEIFFLPQSSRDSLK